LAISKRLRYEILRRDGNRCRYCGVTADQAKLVVDAVVPEALGGSHKDPANLVAACESCNSGKSASSPDAPLVAQVADDAIRWSRAMTAAAGEMLAQASGDVDAHAHFEKAWGRYGSGPERRPLPKDPGWRSTVDSLLSAGLPMTMLEECIQIAMSQRRVAEDNVFRYMCGVAWRKVGELQQRARELTQDGGPRKAANAADAEDPDDDAAIQNWCRVILKQHDQQDVEAATKRCREYADSEEPSGILWFLIQDMESDRISLQDCLRELMEALPGGVGTLRLAEHEAYYLERFGSGYNRRVALCTASQWAAEDMALARARQELASMPRHDYETWVQRARDENAELAEHLSETFYVIEAARMVRESLAAPAAGGD